MPQSLHLTNVERHLMGIKQIHVIKNSLCFVSLFCFERFQISSYNPQSSFSTAFDQAVIYACMPTMLPTGAPFANLD